MPWKSPETHTARYRPIFLKGTLFSCIVTLIIFVLLAWSEIGMRPAILLIPLAAILLSLTIIWGFWLLLPRLYSGGIHPMLKVDRPLEEAITLIEKVLDRHGLAWTKLTESRYAKEGRNEEIRRQCEGQEEELDGYFYDLPDEGLFLVKRSKRVGTITAVIVHRGSNPLPWPLMEDIDEATQ